MKKIFVIIIICFVCVSITLFNINKKSSKEIIYNGNRLLVSIDGKDSNKVPSSGNYYLSSYDCSSKDTIVSWDKNNYNLLVGNGNNKSGVSCYVNFSSMPKLYEMNKGDYVKYSNGINYRIAYTKNHNAYLISEGVLDSVCTNGNGESLVDCGSSVSTDGISTHVKNLNQRALKYCNSTYADGGVCNSGTVWNISQDDFEIIVNRGLNISSCHDLQNKKCGYVNDLIDVDSNYWFSSQYSGVTDKVLYWDGIRRAVLSDISSSSYGVRPIMMIDTNVIVIGGSGTVDDPYQLSNRTFYISSIDKDKKILNLELSGYQVKEMCININSTVCTNYVPFKNEYSLDIGDIGSDNNIIYIYYKNDSGDIVATISRKFSLE